MRNRRTTIYWASLIAITLVTASPLLRADDSSDSASNKDPNEKTVSVDIGGRKLPVRVRDNNPYTHVSSNVSSDGKYHPDEFSFSKTSTMGDKSFALPSSSFSQSNSEFSDPKRNTFVTKSYSDETSSTTTPDANARTSFPTFAAYSRQAADFDKSFLTSSADASFTKADAVQSNTSAYQNRAATLATSNEPAVLSSDPFANKTYVGPGAQNVPAEFSSKSNIVLSRMDGIPSRPLSIDEVRDLINHETKPNTDVKPAEPSKPLNDPNYQPEPLRGDPSPDSDALVPSRTKAIEIPVSTTPSDDDKSDPVPSPGSMAAPAAPENSEPLPQP